MSCSYVLWGIFFNYKSSVSKSEYSININTICYSIFLGLHYSTVQYNIVQYTTVQYSTVQYSIVQCSAVQYSTVHCTRDKDQIGRYAASGRYLFSSVKIMAWSWKRLNVKKNRWNTSKIRNFLKYFSIVDIFLLVCGTRRKRNN